MNIEGTVTMHDKTQQRDGAIGSHDCVGDLQEYFLLNAQHDAYYRLLLWPSTPAACRRPNLCYCSQCLIWFAYGMPAYAASAFSHRSGWP